MCEGVGGRGCVRGCGRVWEGVGGRVWVCVYRAHNAPDFVVSLSKLAMVVIAKHVHLARVEEDGCGER